MITVSQEHIIDSKHGLLRSLRAGLVLAPFYAVLLVMLLTNAHADYIPPGEVTVKTEKYLPETNEMRLGSYRYQVDWQGIPVAKADVVVEAFNNHENKLLYHVRTTTKTRGIVKAFYRLRHRVESIFHADTFKPLQFLTYQTENRKKRYRHVTFGESGDISSKSWKNSSGKNDLNFTSENDTFDPVSAAFLAKSLPIEIGGENTFDVFNGKHRYLITFKVIGKESIKIEDQTREAYKIEPGVKKLTDTEGENRLRSAYLWIAADGSRDVLKLESEVLVGSVTATLERVEHRAFDELDASQPLRARLEIPNPDADIFKR